MTLLSTIQAILEHAISWRRDFHQHPETGYDVGRTAGRVAALLRGFGCDEVVEKIGQAGVVGVIRGRATNSGQTLGLRADMDALPITENTGAAHASTTPGKMHACGHDGHTAILLGAAHYLAQTRAFDGTVVVVFQPAEEDAAGGKAMIDDGLVARFGIDEFYALHNLPGLPLGHIATRPGPIMGTSDEFVIAVRGKGGHPASPHKALDTTMVAAQMLLTLNTIMSRDIDPHAVAALGVTMFSTDSNASNIIAQNVRMEGTVRSLDAPTRKRIKARVTEIVQGVAATFGAKAEVSWTAGYPVALNAPAQTQAALDAARGVAAAVQDNTAPLLQSEDFAYMLQARPGAYVFLGNGDSAMLHDPTYDFDDRAIETGIAWFCNLVETRLAGKDPDQAPQRPA